MEFSHKEYITIAYNCTRMFTVMDSKYFGGNPFYFLLNVRRFAALNNVRFLWSTLRACLDGCSTPFVFKIRKKREHLTGSV